MEHGLSCSFLVIVATAHGISAIVYVRFEGHNHLMNDLIVGVRVVGWGLFC